VRCKWAGVTGDNLNGMGSDVDFVARGRYVGKQKILVSRSPYISDESLVDDCRKRSLCDRCPELFAGGKPAGPGVEENF
jgi:hypothetical protein